jgi:hypothetical protein
VSATRDQKEVKGTEKGRDARLQELSFFTPSGGCVCVCAWCVRDQEDGSGAESSGGASSLVVHVDLVEVGLIASSGRGDGLQLGGSLATKWNGRSAMIKGGLSVFQSIG